MPYVSNPPYNGFSLSLLCSECNKYLPTVKNGFMPNKKQELDWETEKYLSVDLNKPCKDHPEAHFYPIYKTKLRGKELDEAYNK